MAAVQSCLDAQKAASDERCRLPPTAENESFLYHKNKSVFVLSAFKKKCPRFDR